jgi:hypothetical protein
MPLQAHLHYTVFHDTDLFLKSKLHKKKLAGEVFNRHIEEDKFENKQGSIVAKNMYSTYPGPNVFGNN